jgi:hypothetical protein
MKMTDPNEDMLDDLFAQARQVKAPVSDDLMARVLADAVPERRPVATPPTALASVLDTIGGWFTLGGLATATLAGLWIGVAPPAAVEDLTAGLLGDTVTVSLGSGGGLTDFGVFEDG